MVYILAASKLMQRAFGLGMPLVTRGRLSVQRVSQAEWDAINLLADTGGWDDLDVKKLGSSASKAASASKAKPAVSKGKAAAGPKRGKGKKRQLGEDVEEEPEGDEESGVTGPAKSKATAKAPPVKKARRGKQPAADEGDTAEDASSVPVRRSTRRVASKAG